MKNRKTATNFLVTLIVSMVLLLVPMQASAQEQSSAVAGTSTTSTLACVATFGLKVCSPTTGSTVTSPVHVVADAKGSFREMVVTIDGVFKYSALGSHVDIFVSEPVGTHTAHVCFETVAFVSRGICQSVPFTVVASSTCSAPPSAGVHVCSPLDGSTVASPVHALARGLVSGTFARMELWVDGVKKLNSTSTLIDTRLTLGAGTHRFNFRAVNTAGTILSKVVNVTAK